jgi:hypothetical protein
MQFSSEFIVSMVEICVRFLHESEDAAVLTQALQMLPHRPLFYDFLQGQEEAGELFEIIFRLYHTPDLTLAVIDFFSALRNDVLDLLLEHIMELTLPDLVAIDNAYKETNGHDEAARCVACQLLLFWEKCILNTDHARAIAERMITVLFSMISNIPFVEVSATPEWEPFMAAQSCIRAITQKDGDFVLPHFVGYFQDFGDSESRSCREAAICCMRTLIADCREEILQAIAQDCMAFIERRLHDTNPRDRYFAVGCLTVLAGRLDPSVLYGLVEPLFEFICMMLL